MQPFIIRTCGLRAPALQVIVEATKLFKVTVSFGNVNSLISLPCYMSHASIPADVRAARGLPDDLVRISTGIEHADDLIEDLDQAMTLAMQKIGYQPAQASSSSGSGSSNGSSAVTYSFGGNGQQGSQDTERALLARVAALEAQLAAFQVASTSHNGAGAPLGKK